MDIFLNEKFLAALLGFVGGTIATVFGPWVHWGIEKRRGKLAARKEQIKIWRTMVRKVWREEWSDQGEIEFHFMNEIDFLSLSPMLSEHTKKIFESLVMGEGTIFDEYGDSALNSGRRPSVLVRVFASRPGGQSSPRQHTENYHTGS